MGLHAPRGWTTSPTAHPRAVEKSGSERRGDPGLDWRPTSSRPRPALAERALRPTQDPSALIESIRRRLFPRPSPPSATLLQPTKTRALSAAFTSAYAR